MRMRMILRKTPLKVYRNKIVTVDKESWQSVFTSVRRASNKWNQDNFTLNSYVEKELFRFGLIAGCECLYCGEPSSRNILLKTLFSGSIKLIRPTLIRDREKFSLVCLITKTTHLNVLTTPCYSCNTLSINVN